MTIEIFVVIKPDIAESDARKTEQRVERSFSKSVQKGVRTGFLFASKSLRVGAIGAGILSGFAALLLAEVNKAIDTQQSTLTTSQQVATLSTETGTSEADIVRLLNILQASGLSPEDSITSLQNFAKLQFKTREGQDIRLSQFQSGDFATDVVQFLDSLQGLSNLQIAQLQAQGILTGNVDALLRRTDIKEITREQAETVRITQGKRSTEDLEKTGADIKSADVLAQDQAQAKGLAQSSDFSKKVGSLTSEGTEGTITLLEQQLAKEQAQLKTLKSLIDSAVDTKKVLFNLEKVLRELVDLGLPALGTLSKVLVQVSGALVGIAKFFGFKEKLTSKQQKDLEDAKKNINLGNFFGF